MANFGSLIGKRPDGQRVMQHPLVVGTGRVGIEIELEDASELRLTHWNSIRDGSLRNSGWEYVMRQPLGGADLFGAICEIDTALNTISPDASWRCSTHVHVDIRDMTTEQFKKLLLLYIVYEKIIFQCSGLHRYQNNFCPAYGFAQEMIMRLSNIWNRNEEEFVSGLDFRSQSGGRDRDKYNSLNLLPIFFQGSIEFRGSEPKFKKGNLLRLANRLLSLKEFAMSFEGSDEDLILHCSSVHPRDVIKKSLPKKFTYEEMAIEEGVKLAMDVVHLHKFAPPMPTVALRQDRANHWRRRVGSAIPERISVAELAEIQRTRDIWVGDYVDSDNFRILSDYCSANGLSL